jgi:oligopeptide transport system substrate-binding protein
MDYSEATTTRINPARGRATLTIILTLVLLLIISGCESPFDDTDVTVTPTPVDITGDVPEQPEQETPTPEAATEEREDGWTVISSPARSSPPDDRSSDQVFRMAGPSDPPRTIDPALVRDTGSAFVARQVFRGLVRLDSNLEPVPDLAREIEIDPEGRLYRFTLPEDITFHDGTPITAQDIKRSIERATDPALTGGDGDALPSRNYLDDIQGARERMDGEREDIPGIRVVDDLTLEIELDRGVVDFLERLTNPSALIVDADQAANGNSWWREANGTGPFRLAEWDNDSQISLEPHDGYVKPPLLHEVVIRIGAEAVGQMQQYETDQIDVVNVPLSVLDRVQYEGSPIAGDLREQPLLGTSFVLMSPEHEPFDQQAFRESLIHSFPRDQLTEVMLEDRVSTAHGILPPAMTDSANEPFVYAHDPELARERLAELDSELWPERVAIYASGGSIPVAMKHFIEQELELPVEVVQLRWADFIADMEDGRLPIFVLSWVADGPDPVSYLQALFHSESPDNYARFSDPEVDRLLEEAAIEQDEARRTELLLDAHRRILESAVVLPLYHSVDYVLVAEHVRGLETTPMGILGLENVWIE